MTNLLPLSIAIFHGAIVSPILLLLPIYFWISRKPKPWTLWVFGATGAGAIVSFFLTGECILTRWENLARNATGNPTYSGGFVSRYLAKVGIAFPDLATTVLFVTMITFGFSYLLARWRFR